MIWRKIAHASLHRTVTSVHHIYLVFVDVQTNNTYFKSVCNMYHNLKKNWNLENDSQSGLSLDPGFYSMSRIGFIHLFGIIKWLDFIQKWDFYNIFITKKHTFFYIWPKVEYWIPQNITKKCHELSWIFNGISKIILILFAN